VNTHRIMTSAWALMMMLALPSSPASGAPKGEQRVAVVELENNSKLSMGVVSVLS